MYPEELPVVNCPGFTPERDAPNYVTKRLTTFGGLNPFGNPNWRICLAQNRAAMRSGIFHQLPDGELEQFHVGAGGRVQYSEVKPVRVEHGTFPVKKYPGLDGWILERWFPAHLWGTEETWNNQKSSDGITPMMGEYPRHGDYLMLSDAPWSEMPDLGLVERVIAKYNRGMQENPVWVEKYVQSELATLETNREKARAAAEAEYMAYFRSEIDPIFKSTSLAASRLRQDAARAAGQKSHATL